MTSRRTIAAVVLGGLGAVLVGAEVIAEEQADALRGWPERPREAAKAMTKKYGPPDEVTPTMLVWHDTGPWKRTIVHKQEVAHDFPKPHTDLLEQVIDYKVPIDRYDELAAYDGSVVASRTNGELAARCDKEEMNFLAINLAHDVATGAKDVDQAREAYAAAATAFMQKKRPADTKRLQVEPTRGTADPDRPFRMKREP